MKAKETHEISRKKHSHVDISKTKTAGIKIISTYKFNSGDVPITIRIYMKKGEFVPTYDVSITGISKNTEIVLEKIKEKLTSQVSLGMVDILNTKETGVIEKKFSEAIELLLNKYFPAANESVIRFLKIVFNPKKFRVGFNRDSYG